MSSPRTKAGQALLDAFTGYVKACEERGVDATAERLIGEQIRDHHLAVIEAEAAALERERLAVIVRAARRDPTDAWEDGSEAELVWFLDLLKRDPLDEPTP